MTQLTLIRGLPGSGKSTLAKCLNNTEHYEADMYFMRDGVYQFDAAKLSSAHKWCQESALIALQQGHHVVVANTFTTLKELAPYFKMAESVGIVPNVLMCQGNFQNVHGVPPEKLEQMARRFVFDISPLYSPT